MPTPVALPSLRSENAGNDPNISLVPSGTPPLPPFLSLLSLSLSVAIDRALLLGGTGWKHAKEESRGGEGWGEPRREKEERQPPQKVRGGSLQCSV